MIGKKIKECPSCGQKFTARDIVKKKEIVPIGMFYLDDDKVALYLFQHEVEGCQSSFTVNAELLRKHIDEDIPDEKQTLSGCCEQHCVNIKDLKECQQPCYYAPFRRLLLRMLEVKGVTVPESNAKVV